MSKAAREAIKDKDVRVKPVHYPFWFGGSASCMAACVTHPLDLGMSQFLLTRNSRLTAK